MNGSRGARAVGPALVVVLAVVFLVGAGVVVSGARQVNGDDAGFGSTGSGSGGFGWAIGLFAVVFVAVIGAVVAAAVAGARRAAWLDGSVLTVRGLRDSSVDLASARRVWIDTRRVSNGSTTVGMTSNGAPITQSTGYRTVPRINASDGATKVTLPVLAARGSQLPDADWLRAIAADPGRYFR